MEDEMARLMDLDTPKLNLSLANGLAVEDMKTAPEYVHQVMESAMRGLKHIGLEYHGCRRCNPVEEYREVTRRKGPKRTFDVAQSDIFMMQYDFVFKGEKLAPRYMYLPFVSQAGALMLSGARFVISPMLADRVISKGIDSVFVRLLRAKMTFEQVDYNILINGIREPGRVAWSEIYHKNAKQKKFKATVVAKSTIAHYLFCKFGFTQTFQKFANCTPIVGGAEVNHNVYPEEEWAICASTGLKPRGYGHSYFEPSRMRIAVRKEELTPFVKNLIAGFFYVADRFRNRIEPEYIDSKRVWKILLGQIIFSSNVLESELHDQIDDHIASLDEYLDPLVIEKLADIGIPITDVYQMFAMVVEKLNEWLRDAADNVSSVYEKELSIRYPVLYEYSSAIFKLYFKLKAASKRELSKKDVETAMNGTLRQGIVFSLTKNHPEISNISSPGDNKAFKITSQLIPQERANQKGGRKDRQVMDDPSKYLHVSIIEHCAYSVIPKSAPDGRSRLNHMTSINEKGVLQRSKDPVIRAELDEAQAILKH